MTKPIPQIQKYMTMTPYSIEKDAPLLEAAKLMQKHQIRHLPVLYQGKIEGVLSSTDVMMIQTIKGMDMEKLRVLDCFTANPYKVSPNAPLNEVMDEMAENKYGCVLIDDNEKLVGIFTWVDALKATKSLLETRLSN